MPEIDINKPVRVTIEITGPDLDTCLYAMDQIREDMSGEKLNSSVRVAHEESYSYRVRQLEGRS